jgi:hypothetical protein
MFQSAFWFQSFQSFHVSVYSRFQPFRIKVSVVHDKVSVAGNKLSAVQDGTIKHTTCHVSTTRLSPGVSPPSQANCCSQRARIDQTAPRRSDKLLSRTLGHSFGEAPVFAPVAAGAPSYLATAPSKNRRKGPLSALCAYTEAA